MHYTMILSNFLIFFPQIKIMDTPVAQIKDQSTLLEDEDAQRRNIEFAVIIEELTIERDCLKTEFFGVEAKVREREEELLRRIQDGFREKECLEVEIYEGMREREELVSKHDFGLREKVGLLKDFEVLKGKNEEFEVNLSRGFKVLGLIKDCLIKVNDCFNGKGFEENVLMIDCKRSMEGLLEELDFVSRLAKRVEDRMGDYGGIKDLLNEVEAYKKRTKEFEENLLRNIKVLDFIKECFMRIHECLDDKEVEIMWVDHDECHSIEEQVLNVEEKLEGLMNAKLDFVSRMAKGVEEKMNVHLEKVNKEKKELERSVMSLTEENRDVNALLRIALVEKEAVEKSLSKLKGNNEQRRVPLLQFAERGLQRVGFGFIIGGASNEQHEDQNKNADQTSDCIMSGVSSECQEEVVSLASTVEKLMKGLRLKITQLRRDLEDSRFETERLQSLTEKQAQKITEQIIYIKELEERETLLSKNVEELLVEMKAMEEEIQRWREACELEMEAGKHVAQEHNKVVAILKQELEKTRTALQVSNKKLKLKEEVAVAAMAAQSAAEKSLQLADNRAAVFRERIEELTRQVEEDESKQKNNKRRLRRICWPWQALYPATTNSRVGNLDIKHMLPEMQAFLHQRI
ncbi:uncharacterized protein At3g49055-like [Chenopodium quinoa]|uniref:uncharacterized protein At3g49055-like n=1 Tax=Chenopodium quinoa TaxID=63459 RepID=UPI000B76DF59|nr:uncharacterized protein At3g49055-like [Chenopodium quinoa]